MSDNLNIQKKPQEVKRYKITITMESGFPLTHTEESEVVDFLSDSGYEEIEIEQTEAVAK